MFIANMNVMQKSRLLTKPTIHLRQVQQTVRCDKTSILSGAGSMIGEAALIDQKSIQERIVRKSIRMVLPNADRSFLDGKMSQQLVYQSKLQSPGPKKPTHGRLSSFGGITPQMFAVGPAAAVKSLSVSKFTEMRFSISSEAGQRIGKRPQPLDLNKSGIKVASAKHAEGPPEADMAHEEDSDVCSP